MDKQGLKEELNKMINTIVEEEIKETARKYETGEVFEKGKYVAAAFVDEDGKMTSIHSGKIEDDKTANPIGWIVCILSNKYKAMWLHPALKKMVDDTADIIIEEKKRDPEFGDGVSVIDFVTKVSKFMRSMFEQEVDKGDFKYSEFDDEESLIEFINDHYTYRDLKNDGQVPKEKLN